MNMPNLRHILQSPLFRNFSMLTGATMVSYLLSFFVIMHVARVLGPEEYGKVGFAQAFVSYFMLIASMGLETLGLRDIAKDKSKSVAILTNITVLRVSLFIVAYGAMAGTLYLFPKDHVSNMVVLVFGTYMLLTPVQQEWYYIGNEQFKIVSISRIVHSVLYCVLVFIFIGQSDQVVEFTALQAGTYILPLAILWFPVAGKVKSRYLDKQQISAYARSGVWLMLSSFMGAIYWNMDKVMLGYWYADKYVGWYDAAYKVISLLLVPSTLLWGVLSPRIARRERRDIWLSVFFLVAGGGFLALCAIPSRHLIIQLVFGEQYAPAAAPLGILALAMFANHCSRAFSCPLQLWGGEKIFFLAAMAGAAVNVVMNVLLIPRYALVGAAWATVAADTMVTLFSLPFFVREMRKGPSKGLYSEE